MTALDGGPCCVCKRRDDGVGHMRGPKGRVTWACMDHIHLAERVAKMPRKEMDVYEHNAMEKAMADAAAFLEQRNTSDLFDMDETTAAEFFRKFLDNYGLHLSAELTNKEPPF